MEWLSYSDRNEASRPVRCLGQGLLRTSSGGSLKRSGWRRASGLGSGPPRPNIECPKARGLVARLPGAPKGSPHGSAGCRRGSSRKGSASAGRRTAPPPVLVVPVPDPDSGAPLQGVPWWKPRQKILCAEVRKKTGRWKDRWKIRDLLADERCSRAVLDFLTSTDVGKWAPAEEEDTVSEVSGGAAGVGGGGGGWGAGRRGGITTIPAHA